MHHLQNNEKSEPRIKSDTSDSLLCIPQFVFVRMSIKGNVPGIFMEENHSEFEKSTFKASFWIRDDAAWQQEVVLFMYSNNFRIEIRFRSFDVHLDYRWCKRLRKIMINV